jgi:dTMP kinase
MTLSGKGLFITVEGIDGCGKSTQARRIRQWLEGTFGCGRVLQTFEPGGWSEGVLLRRVLLRGGALTPRTELLLFLADRSGHLDAAISPALASGRWVVCERYTDSTLAYQSWGRGIPLQEINELLGWCHFRTPDMTVLLDIDEETAKSRLAERRELDRIESGSDDAGFMGRVARGYRELAKRNSDRIVVVNGAMDVEEVTSCVCAYIERRLKEQRP